MINRDSGNKIMDRFGGVILTLLVAVGFGVYTVLTQASRDSTGAIDSAGQVDAFDVRLGDCFNDESPIDTDEVYEVNNLSAVPCLVSHDNEIFALFDIELAEFPGNEAVDDIASAGCHQRFEPYVGRDYDTSSLEISYLFPTSESWADRDDREIACILFDMELNKIEGSMRGSGI